VYNTAELSFLSSSTKGGFMPTWIDFRALRSKLDFEQVLRHYGVEVRRKGKQHLGYCPLPNHNGKKNSPSFSANLEKGIFQCFGCGAKGNLLEFAVLMEKADPKDGAALHEVAVELQKRFCPEIGDATAKTEKAATKQPEKIEPKRELPVVVNASLDFELKGLDAGHPYLLGRGFTPETIKHFGLGFCSRGYLKNRVVIPLHDASGTFVGYAGRVVDDSLITKDNPRYKFPGERERDGRLYQFRKTLFVYYGFWVRAPVDDLPVVEGFPSVWWLVQNGLPDVVSTMGSDCSERQAELIVSLVKPKGRVWIVPDGDKAGERYAQTLLSLISPHRFVRWVKMADGKQPTDLSAEQLRAYFKP
jgi:DNA primase